MSVPENPKFWNMLRRQASAMYPGHGKLGQLSAPAAKWLHSKYEQEGGQFVGSTQQVPQQFRDLDQEKLDSEKRKEQEKKKQEGNVYSNNLYKRGGSQ